MNLNYHNFLSWLETNGFRVVFYAPDPEDESPTFATEIILSCGDGEIYDQMLSLEEKLPDAPLVENDECLVENWNITGEIIRRKGVFLESITLKAELMIKQSTTFLGGEKEKFMELERLSSVC